MEKEDSFTSSSNQVPSPDLFSPEDEETYNKNECLPSPSPPRPSEPSEEELVLRRETARLQRLQELLQGVPPPPSVTIPQISVSEVLQLWKENNEKLAIRNNEAVDRSLPSDKAASLCKPNTSEEDATSNFCWPDVKKIIFHDVYYNLSTASEDVERLSLKLYERHVGAETSTWCNVHSLSMPSSAKKRQARRGLGHTSPGARLSHLARRRQTFSSANLAQLSSVAGSGTAGGAPAALSGSSARRPLIRGSGGMSERRHIMVEIKKTDKNKRIKTNNKVTAGGPNPSASTGAATKSVPDNKPVLSTKRALFQSPEEQRRASTSSCPPSVAEQNKMQRSKRALWPSDTQTGANINENGKRSLDADDSASMQRSKVPCREDAAPYTRTTRSLPFSLGLTGAGSNGSSGNSSKPSTSHQDDGSKAIRRASDQGPGAQAVNSLSDLSELHKRKLFWAISQALRNENISSKHVDFRPCASILANHYIQVRRESREPPPASTSEHMLKVVSDKAHDVVQAYKATKSGQEENQSSVGKALLKKEEKSNKELFKDATASLNVRRSLSVSLLSSNRPSTDTKPRQSKKIPSARKSLSFEAFEMKGCSSQSAQEPAEEAESRLKMEAKLNEVDRKSNGENVPIVSAKRVSRSLFLSPKDEAKSQVSKKDASEQTCDDLKCDKKDLCILENGAASSNSSAASAGTSDGKLQIAVKLSAPSSEPVKNTSDADSEASTSGSNQSSQVEGVSINNVHVGNEASLNSGELCHSSSAAGEDSLKRDRKLSSEIYPNDSETSVEMQDCSTGTDFVQTRTLRETKRRSARLSQTVPLKRITRRSLSLSKREYKVISNEAGELTSLPEDVEGTVCLNGDIPAANGFESTILVNQQKHPSKNGVSSKEEEVSSIESSNTAKSVFASPPFIQSESNTPKNSPFLGFQLSDEVNTSGGALSLIVDGSSSIIKVPVTGEGSAWLDTTLSPEPSKNVKEDYHGEANIESKVITPLLEGAILESSVCVGGSSNSGDADLSFRGRIESLKPAPLMETSIDIGLGMNLSSNLLNMEENKEKSPLLEKWAERASRSTSKTAPLISCQNVLEKSHKLFVPPDQSGKNICDESLLPWEESQVGTASQCSSKLFEEYRSIFDSSSHQGGS